MIDVALFQNFLIVLCVVALIAAVILGCLSTTTLRLRIVCRSVALVLGTMAGLAGALLVLLK